MKHLLKLTALMGCILAYAQDYSPLLDNRNEWQLINCYMGDCLTDVFYTDGDTLVNGQTYKILDGYHYISRSFWIREDTSQKKIYLKTVFDAPNEETLLYDFNLEPGDEVHMFNPISPFPADGGLFVVDSIELKPTTANNESRFYYFSPHIDNEENFGVFPIWVEGLGSLALINAPGGHPDYEGAGQISCFWKNQDLFYWDHSQVEACEAVMGVKANEKSKLRLLMNRQNHGFLDHAEKVEEVLLYDRMGRRLANYKGNRQHRMEFDWSTLEKGVYFLKIKEGNRWLSEAFVIR